jgi:GR25 family glycosyltransferase involved in LPS biosynthesis
MVRKLNVYIIHAKPIKERESVIQNLKSSLKKYKFRNILLSGFTVIEEYDPVDIDMNTIRLYVNYNKVEEPHVEGFNQLLKNMHINQLSNALKHFKAMELIAKTSNDGEVNLVLEDDVLYEDKFCYSLDKLVASLPTQFDMIFLGIPPNNQSEKPSTFEFQETQKVSPVLPFCDSYLISHSASKALVPNYIPIKFINNIHMSYNCVRLGLKTLNSVPNIFIDGSKYGMFLSKLTNNNPLIFNADFTQLRSILNKDVLDENDKQNVEKIISRTPLKGNPDFIHLESAYHLRSQDYQKAKARLEEAYNTYVANGCILGNDSVFLRDYIKVHKHLQDDIDESHKINV